jgi:hypothetical protein
LDEALSEEQIRREHIPRELGSPTTRSLYKFFYSEVEEPELIASLAAARCPMSEEEFAYFFVDKTNILSQATAAQRAYLNRCYPDGRVHTSHIARTSITSGQI